LKIISEKMKNGMNTKNLAHREKKKIKQKAYQPNYKLNVKVDLEN